MDLPPELRVEIYRLYFKSMPDLEQPAQPPISRICRTVRRESLPIFYQTCTFLLDSEKRVKSNEADAEADGEEESDENDSDESDSDDDDSDDEDDIYRSVYGQIKGDFFRDVKEDHIRTIRRLTIIGFFIGHEDMPQWRAAFIDFGTNIHFRLKGLRRPSLIESLTKHLEDMRERSDGNNLTKADVEVFRQLFKREQDEKDELPET